ncbi:hypothetical protein [Bradyrhizobium sp. CCGUVB23]|uniref:hypothetical protein n=1 Tax=Bradyrhizobium sp. CCGUVB23 TaxID=2949630 RepID=UPI0020B2159F|nr:hypothetical protein [Bradyrhizobium sp. CCGUVB23]MCP3461100.1 hypothetical protein [Bradyrhizobium sp. CCGUVB23]
MPSDATKLCSSLQRALLKLRASGADGFEGFIRDAFIEATGISGRIQKSSAQGGVDAIADEASGQIAVGIEAKRYRETTGLALDDLKKKVHDAATRSGSPIELWILAASKEVSADDVGELKKIGEEQGLGVLVLDWGSRGDFFARLPLLLSLAPHTVERVLGHKLGQAIGQVADHPEFEARKTGFLREVQHPDLGRIFTADSVRARIGQTLQTRGDSKSRLQNSVDLRAPGRIWAQRDDECAAVSRWAGDPGAPPICAVLGEEGAGKTWLLFDWWQREAARDPARLCVWFAARDVTSGSLADVLAAALDKWAPSPGRSAAFWGKRVQRWRQNALAHPGEGPFIWLMLDGTNEGTAQALVTQLLTEAADSDWKGAVRIVLTDRPLHWQSGFRSGQFLEPRPATLTVSHFRKTELDALLARHGKTRAAFSPQVLSLIKWPSWFAVAAEMFDQEYDWTAHSAEQLMLRYVQHRVSTRVNAPIMDDAVFRQFLSDLGRDIQRSWNTSSIFSRAALKAKLAGFTGGPEKDILQAIDEVTSGVWFRPTAAHQFEIDKAVLPLAIGLALHSELKSLTTEEEIDSSADRFLGPTEDQSLGVNILAAVIALTFLDKDYPALVIRVLLRRWITSHNFSGAHFQQLWRIGSVNPAPLLDVAEAIWLQRSEGTSVDEILIKSIANVGRDGGKEADVIAFLAKWARTYWPAPREGQFINYHPSPGQRAEAFAATQARLDRIRSDIGPESFAGLDLIRAEDGISASWVFYRTNSIATYLPRAAQAPLWRGWVASRAVMGSENHLDDVAWSLRVNTVDAEAATEVLLQTVDGLLALPSTDIRARATSLLEAHGGAAALAKIALVQPDIRQSSSSASQASLVDGFVTFSGKEPPNEVVALSILSEFAADPDAGVAPKHLIRLKRYARSFPVTDLGDGRGQTAAGIDLERTMPALARWAPKELVALYRRFLLSIGHRDETRLLGYTFSLEKLAILLTPPIQKKICKVLMARRKDRHESEFDQVDHALVTTALFGNAPREQMTLWHELGAPRSPLLELKHVLRAPSPSQVKGLGARLAPDQPVDRLAGWLAYLMLSAARELPPRWNVLARLFDHEEPSIREYAFSIALDARDKFLAQRHLKSPWRASAERPVKENWAGASLLAMLATPRSFKAIAERTGAEWSMIPWHVVKYRPDCAYAFEAFLKARVEQELNPPRTRTLLGYRITHERATKKLVEQKPGELAMLADRLFEVGDDPAFARWEFPRMDLMQAFLELQPAKGAQYWTKLSRSDSVFQPGEDIEQAPFEASDGEEVNALRRQQIMDASNDWKLLTLATFIVRHKRTAWAIALIKELLGTSGVPGDIARAITLAGFLDDSPSVRLLWKNDLAAAPIDGWIGAVYQDAKRNIQKTWRCLAWLDVALAAKDDERFFVAWELFAHLCERSAIPVTAQRLRAKPKTRSPRHREFIALRFKKIHDKSMKSESRLKERLFSFQIGHRWAKPWADS